MCQDMLFNNIKEGSYEFSDPEWTDISSGAKDLIGHLLVKNPIMRYSADDVLQHPWITMKTSQAPLATPKVLQRNNSVRELHLFAENANALNRMIQHHLSISQVFHPPKFCLDPGSPSPPDEENGGVAFKASGIVHSDEERAFHLPGDLDELLDDSGIGSRESVGKGGFGSRESVGQ